MASIGNYSRHLTEEDISRIGAATRSIITMGGVAEEHKETLEGELSRLQKRGGDNVVFTGETRSVLNGLFYSGHYDAIIRRILGYLNATQLACLQKTCRPWSEYIEDFIWKDTNTLERIRTHWGSYMPKVFVLTNQRPLLALHCTETHIMGGEEKTGRLVVFNRAAMYQPQSPGLASEVLIQGLNEDTMVGDTIILPEQKIEAHKAESSVTCIDSQGDVVVTGGTDGAVRLHRLSTGAHLCLLSQAASLVYGVRIDKNRVFATAGSKVTVQTITLTQKQAKNNLSHVLEGHSREVLCLDVQRDVVVTGSMDKTLMLFRLGPGGVSKLLHTLEGHKLKVRCVAMSGGLLVSGSWDRTAKVWDVQSGECLRSLEHEMQIRSVALDSHRILTGDQQGYIFAWDLENVLDETCGPNKLCLRAHNAMDPHVYDSNAEKPVYGVHLETAAMIQVAGCTGRIEVQDFWHTDGHDAFQLESYMHDNPVRE